MARQLPTDMRDWRAADALAYNVHDEGVHLMLGKLNYRNS